MLLACKLPKQCERKKRAIATDWRNSWHAAGQANCPEPDSGVRKWTVTARTLLSALPSIFIEIKADFSLRSK